MIDPYLESTDVIDWRHPEVLALARRLGAGAADPLAVAGRCFAWVRDEIRHTGDHGLSMVTCAASEVLRHGSGFCYGKSHLLAALLRACAIPAALCYQRLRVDDEGRRFCLHGLNAALLPGLPWCRLDARGDRPDLTARFAPPAEHLPYRPTAPGEADLPELWPAPLPVVLDRLRAHSDAGALAADLPDVPLWTGTR